MSCSTIFSSKPLCAGAILSLLFLTGCACLCGPEIYPYEAESQVSVKVESEVEPEQDFAAALAESEAEPQEEVVLDVARATVEELLEKMGVEASVSASFGEAEDERSRIPLIVDISGEDLSILIGSQAETLNALQYIANLIIGKELGRSAPLVLDVEGYIGETTDREIAYARRKGKRITYLSEIFRCI